jgi:hypothetical protein
MNRASACLGSFRQTGDHAASVGMVEVGWFCQNDMPRSGSFLPNQGGFQTRPYRRRNNAAARIGSCDYRCRGGFQTRPYYFYREPHLRAPRSSKASLRQHSIASKQRIARRCCTLESVRPRPSHNYCSRFVLARKLAKCKLKFLGHRPYRRPLLPLPKTSASAWRMLATTDRSTSTLTSNRLRTSLS